MSYYPSSDHPPPFELHGIEISLQEWPTFQIAVRERRPMTVLGHANMVPISYEQSGHGATHNFRCVADFRQIVIVSFGTMQFRHCPTCGLPR